MLLKRNGVQTEFLRLKIETAFLTYRIPILPWLYLFNLNDIHVTWEYELNVTLQYTGALAPARHRGN